MLPGQGGLARPAALSKFPAVLQCVSRVGQKAFPKQLKHYPKKSIKVPVPTETPVGRWVAQGMLEWYVGDDLYIGSVSSVNLFSYLQLMHLFFAFLVLSFKILMSLGRS